MSKLTVHDFRAAQIAEDVGICSADLPNVCRVINMAIQRLLFATERGEEGWSGCWAKMVFNVSRAAPYITTPREVVRLATMDVCRVPVRIQNEWFEFLDFGVGLQKPNCGTQGLCQPMQAYDRGIFVTTVDPVAGEKLRVYWTNTGDNQKNLFFEGKDNNDNPIYTVFNGQQVNGVYLTINTAFPFIDTIYKFNSISNIAKDVTFGPVNLYSVSDTGVETLLQSFAPNQTTASYRRYLVQNLPKECFDCGTPTGVSQITALAELQFIPVTCDSDFLIIGNLPAMQEEVRCMRYEGIDNPAAAQKSIFHHKQAIRYLNGELVATNGRKRPALSFHPWGRGVDANLQMI